MHLVRLCHLNFKLKYTRPNILNFKLDLIYGTGRVRQVFARLTTSVRREHTLLVGKTYVKPDGDTQRPIFGGEFQNLLDDTFGHDPTA